MNHPRREPHCIVSVSMRLVIANGPVRASDMVVVAMHRLPLFRKLLFHVHLADGSRNFSPDVVNLLVQPLQGEDLKLVIRLREEANKAGCR